MMLKELLRSLSYNWYRDKSMNLVWRYHFAQKIFVKKLRVERSTRTQLKTLIQLFRLFNCFFLTLAIFYYFYKPRHLLSFLDFICLGRGYF